MPRQALVLPVPPEAEKRLAAPGSTGASLDAPVAGAASAGKVRETPAPEAPSQVAAAGKPEVESGGVVAKPAAKGQGGTALTSEELAVVRELQGIDTAVRAHEAAHMAAGAGLASGASFSYVQGPDGRSYAVGGEVGIDTSGESTPEATITKMQQVRAAALAPANPSPQDRLVAAQASGAIIMAQAELQQIAMDKASVARESSGAVAVVEASGFSAQQERAPVPGIATFPGARAAADYAAAGQNRSAAGRQGNGLHLIA